MTSDLLDPADLAALLDGPDAAAVVLLDVRWKVGAGADHDAYLAGHLPGAVFVDLDRDLAGPAGTGGRHPLPDPAALQEVWRRCGIDDGDTVVVHDGHDGSAAVRAWWVARWSGLRDVRVLDGGLAAWTGPLETGEVVPEPGTVTVAAGAMPVVDVSELDEPTAAGILLDARAAARYRGEFEPLDPVAGHIPGAVNLPFAELYTDDFRLRPAAELRQVFDAAGIRPATPAVASCGSGVTACHLILAGRVAGVELALYPGSYSQWCALQRPVETG
ncbi:sulfurtransferase [Nakamurella sp. YIM 132087]|uniref:Sulfurtransferase n=1 Tax=Nakamurella alba TaxID=2665158 RepID=A0A7K1FQR7_9ACTN|nr:sulfurtransferase [Nakamurella alba]MTD16491.1 sulfurtransferase [Nakamurella alba]